VREFDEQGRCFEIIIEDFEKIGVVDHHTQILIDEEEVLLEMAEYFKMVFHNLLLELIVAV
jgi:hypothetical protein